MSRLSIFPLVEIWVVSTLGSISKRKSLKAWDPTIIIQTFRRAELPPESSLHKVSVLSWGLTRVREHTRHLPAQVAALVAAVACWGGCLAVGPEEQLCIALTCIQILWHRAGG